jgi:hypothetical protein
VLLIKGEIKPEEFVKMEEKELANDELKKKNDEIMRYEMQAKRSDLALEHMVI